MTIETAILLSLVAQAIIFNTWLVKSIYDIKTQIATLSAFTGLDPNFRGLRKLGDQNGNGDSNEFGK